MTKIKILITNLDKAGVAYWRSITPALSLDKYHNDDFDVTLNQNVNWDDYEYLKEFNIIHSHRQFGEYEKNDEFFSFCEKNGIITILDLDDNPQLNPAHPLYHVVKTQQLHIKTFNTIRRCDALTTTTDYFADFLRKYNPNVIALQNAIDVTLMPQFSYKRKESDKLRFGYIGGSSHEKDVNMLTDMFQLISSNPSLLEKSQYSLHGYDLRGSQNNISMNPELLKDLATRNININMVFGQFNNCDGDINKVPAIPTDLKEKYKYNFIYNEDKPLDPRNSVWNIYEKVFTDNYKLLKDQKYVDYLKSFDSSPFEGEELQPYRRFWTKNVNSYAMHYDNIDVSIVPLVVNDFNNCKSPLKIAEAQAKRCSIIVSNNPIYTKYIKHEVNGFIAKDSRDFFKITKRLINEPNLVTDTANKLIEDTKDEFDLKLVTEKRANFYKGIFAVKNSAYVFTLAK